LSHGRTDAFDAVWAGATTTAQPFPNANPSIFADFGETMAEARGRISCATDCAAVLPRVDVAFEDVWADPNVQAPAASLAYLYADLATPAPVSAACQQAWAPDCRTVINYEAHIHPLWALPRLAADGLTDVTCVNCHRPLDDMGAARVPDGQLDLTDGVSPDEADHFKAYRELLFPDNEQVLDMGAPQDRLVEAGIDPVTGDPILDTVNRPPVMSTAGARASAGFFDRFAPGATHDGYLTDAELRLLAEWLDIGGQYFNNPFDVPIN
jgi:hypothetical protein